jgi:hypothetical protein
MNETYFLGDVLSEGYQNGCLLDLRLKLAIEFLKTGVVPQTLLGPLKVQVGSSCQEQIELPPAGRATYALELADQLFKGADLRGWVHALPNNSELSPQLRQHIERSANAAVAQHNAQQRAAQQEGPVIGWPSRPA